MFTDIISKINTVLQALISDNEKYLAAKYDYPEENVTTYPAAVFFPANFTNQYDNVAENRKVYTFTIFLLQEMNVQTKSNAYTVSMPALLDEIIQAFDESWNQGASSDGNRIWWTLTNGAWVEIKMQNGNALQAELTLEVKVNTQN